ncbi:hypothetical protein HYY74_02035 [Candidatus Woesearchaeota archaeon]|nr:hypothetical protein [Candidatus Woesearchaeota archaeon]
MSVPEMYNSACVANTLKAITRVFNRQGIEYRALGSVLAAAINGFRIVRKQKAGFRWTEARRENCVPITIILFGNFSQEAFTAQLAKGMELKASEEYVKPTTYRLLGYEIIGVHLSAVLAGVKISGLNPKRGLDRSVLMKRLGRDLASAGLGTVKVRLLRVDVPYLYAIFSLLYNLYGGIRVLLGKKYEVW